VFQVDQMAHWNVVVTQMQLLKHREHVLSQQEGLHVVELQVQLHEVLKVAQLLDSDFVVREVEVREILKVGQVLFNDLDEVPPRKL